MAIEKVLVIDDEEIMRRFVQEFLERIDIEVYAAESGQRGIEYLKQEPFDLVITDMKMPKVTGLDVLKKVKEIAPETLVVVVTAYGSIDNAVEAMRLGAFNYLLKPFSPDIIETILDKANEHLSLVQENQYLRNEMIHGEASNSPYLFIAESPAMKKIKEETEKIAKSHASVFISGESGTGKEVVAQHIHHHSDRKDKPFIKVNCAAVAETLIESEFFGHEKGSFTGASARRLGRFELANHGTLLLDEISEIPPSIQAKLLRVTQEREFERVGGTKPIKVDVRLISTSNRDMQEMIKQKVMREDLFYRLNVIPIFIPPLRERREDIIPLSEYFLQRHCRENHRPVLELEEAAKDKLVEYDWPGNVRELANILERAVVTLDKSLKSIGPDALLLESMSVN